MIKAVLFDMDGVLFDTERLAALADRDAAREMGYEIDDVLLEKLTGSNAVMVNQYITDAFGAGFDMDRFYTLVRKYMRQRTQEEGGIKKMHGLDDALTWLRDNGIRMSVVSSSGLLRIQELLDATGTGHYFDEVIAGDMVKNSKPAPDIYLHACQALQVAPQDCLAVEDSYNGVNSACAAGIKTVMIPDQLPAIPEMECQVVAVLQNLAQLPALVQSL